MIKIRVENVTDAKHRAILNNILAGEFSYTPEGEQIDSETFEFSFGLGEYAVVIDELLSKYRENLAEEESGYHDVYNALPKSVNTSEGDEFTVTL